MSRSFRFLHAADIHLDSPLRGLSRYETAPVEAIRGATRRAFTGLMDLALEERVDFLLLVGDLYDGDGKDFGTGIFLSKQIGRLAEHGIQVFAVAGNHDAESKITRALHPPSNMRFLSTRRPETVVLEAPQVALHGQGFPSQQVSENLALEYPPARPDCFNIGLLHTSLDGREGHAVYAPCRLDDLKSKGYQYWALGHVHTREVVSEDPWVVYPGCLQGRHIRESGEKGCTLVTVEDGAVRRVESVCVDVFRWSRCDVDLEDAADSQQVARRLREALAGVIEGAEERPVAARVRLHGACPVADELASDPHRLEQEVRARAAEVGGDALWVEKVQLETTGKLDLEAALAGEDARGEVLRAILGRAEDPASIPGLDETLVKLRAALPDEAIRAPDGLGLDDPQEMRRLVTEAKQLLLGRLLAERVSS